MENYKNKLKMQNKIFIFGILLLVAVQVLAFFQVVTPIAADAHWASGWNGFIAGLSLAMTLFLVIGLFINLRALSNEGALKKLHVKEHDERSEQIVLHAQSYALRIFLMGMLPVIVVCGYFSVLVCVTCAFCEVALSLLACGAKLYWHKRL